MRKKFILWLLLTIILIATCYFLVDRQLVFALSYDKVRQYNFLKWIANDIPSLISAIALLSYCIILLRLIFSNLQRFDHLLLALANSVAIVFFIKQMLKLIFARYWPATFQGNANTLLSNHSYGFNWFKSGVDYGSFPSGHVAVTAAFAICAICIWPKLRWCWLVIIALVAASQVILYYHFLSDAIGGVFIGAVVGYSVAKISANKLSIKL